MGLQVTLRMSTPEVEISECAKICYGTKQLEEGGKNITTTIVHSHKHLASLRFAYATITVEGISVACQNQIVRSKHLDFMVQSKRYVNPDKGGFEFVMPEGLDGLQQKVMQNQWNTALNSYRSLVSQGVKKEDARAVLPANTSTKMNITGNLQGWWGFFKLRLSLHAQTEIRTVANEIYRVLQEQYPLVFTDGLHKELEGG